MLRADAIKTDFAENADIEDDAVEAADRAVRFLHHAPDVGFDGNIDLDRGGRSAFRRNPIDGRLRGGADSVDNRDLRAAAKADSSAS